jgi:uncharacterized protein (TIGR03435 family)
MKLIGGDIGLLAGQIEHVLRKPVVDKTGLTGRYDLNLHWTPTEDPFEGLSKATEEQLGLRLEEQQIPVETFTVDRIEMPAQN